MSLGIEIYIDISIEMDMHIDMTTNMNMNRHMYMFMYIYSVPKAAHISEYSLGVYMGASPLAGKFPKAV